MSPPIERIVVPLDATSENRTAIDRAVRLAARTHAPLHGIFVEDEDLLRLVRLPFARQVTSDAGARPLTPEDAELYLRIAADRSRRDLFAAAQRQQVTCSFEIIRGGGEAALCAVTERDLIVAGGLTRPVGRHFRVECRWWSSIEVTLAPFLLARHDWAAGEETVALLRDRGPTAARLLDAAVQIAQAQDGTLTLVFPPAVADAGDLDTWLAEQLRGRPVRLKLEAEPLELAALRRRIGRLDCGLLAVEVGLAVGRAKRVRELVEGFSCDVLIVR
jgi:nucleotide-binding universal stress UspA family protein